MKRWSHKSYTISYKLQIQAQLHTTGVAAHNTISGIVRETCRTIVNVLGPEHLKWPKTQAGWRNIASGFEERLNFKGCLGAIDGKHVSVKKPPASGSNYFNYLRFFFIILLRVVDSAGRLLYAGAGVNGKASDGGVWEKSKFNQQLTSGELDLPGQGDSENPFVSAKIASDQAFSAP